MQLGWRQGDYLHDVMIFLSGKFQRKKKDLFGYLIIIEKYVGSVYNTHAYRW